MASAGEGVKCPRLAEPFAAPRGWSFVKFYKDLAGSRQVAPCRAMSRQTAGMSRHVAPVSTFWGSQEYAQMCKVGD